jgi:hypothetical protein
MTGVFYGIFNPGNWWLYLIVLMIIIWLFKKPTRRDEGLAREVQALEARAKDADQLLFDRVEDLERQLNNANHQLGLKTSDQQKTINDLQARIQILETIVTDSRYDLDRKISAL